MNVIDALKRKLKEQKGRIKPPQNQKKQLNTNVSPLIIRQIRRMAVEFAVPQYAITEHLLETGLFYISRILKQSGKIVGNKEELSLF